jgi:hypothetical protein
LPSFSCAAPRDRSSRNRPPKSRASSLFIPKVTRLDLHTLPSSHRNGPTFLNVLLHLDIPQAVALAAGRSTVALYTRDVESWRYPQSVATALGWGEMRLQIRKPLEPATPASR